MIMNQHVPGKHHTPRLTKYGTPMLIYSLDFTTEIILYTTVSTLQIIALRALIEAAELLFDH